MNKSIKTIEELEKDLKVLYAKYFQTIERLKNADKELKELLSDLSLKKDEALNHNDLINVIRSNCAYMNLLSLSRSYMDDIRSLKRFLQVLKNTEAK